MTSRLRQVAEVRFDSDTVGIGRSIAIVETSRYKPCRYEYNATSLQPYRQGNVYHPCHCNPTDRAMSTIYRVYPLYPSTESVSVLTVD